jgi:hypothetical protein
LSDRSPKLIPHLPACLGLPSQALLVLAVRGSRYVVHDRAVTDIAAETAADFRRRARGARHRDHGYRRGVATGAALVVTMALAACGKTAAGAAHRPADNTSEVCVEYWSVVQKYNKPDNPQRAALAKAIADEYQGHGQPGAVAAANAALFHAYATDLRPSANRASKPELRSALSGAADRFDRSAAQSAGTAEPLSQMQAVAQMCPPSSPTQ